MHTYKEFTESRERGRGSLEAETNVEGGKESIFKGGGPSAAV